MFGTGRRKPKSRRSTDISKIEQLETRVLLSASSTVQLSLVTTPALDTSGSPNGLSPAMIEQAYNLANLNFDVGGNTVSANGAGETIAIVDAYGDPDISSDLQTFDANFGLTNDNASGQFVLTVATPEGAVATNAGWATEESLDVEWAHAIAPEANILLVEAPTADTNSLADAVVWAAQQPGVVAVSMSWGDSPEFEGETEYDHDFTTPSGHEGVTFVAASGDDAEPNYPSTSPNVLAVGGTTLTVDDSGNWIAESAWDDSGGGVSPYEGTHKPDVSYDADPDTGFLVYDSIPDHSPAGWEVVGGTSAGTPQWAAIIAIADQGRALRSVASLDGPTQTISDLYALPSTDFNDVTGGGLTGLGSPNGELIISAFVGGGITAVGSTQPPDDSTQLVFTQEPTNTEADGVINPAITVSIEDADGNVVTTDDSDVTIVLGSGPGALSGTLTVAANDGVATFTDVSPSAAGTYTLKAIDGSLTNATSTSFTVVPDGWVDSANMNEIIGWAVDPGDPSASINVEVVITNGPSQTFLADQSRGDLTAYIGSSNHGFVYDTPVLSVGAHTVDIYAVDNNGTKVLLATKTVVSQNSLFDEHYYLQTYPNVAAAVADGQFATGYDHYIEYGQYEGYSPSPYWNESWYLKENPDVAAAVKAGVVSSGFMQYYVYGQFENRGGLLYFNSTYYLQNNPGIATQIAEGLYTSPFEQFVLAGQYAGMAPMLYFSSAVYDADNQDILPYITGEGFSSDYEQYIEYGQYEGRVASNFYNEQIYLSLNPDVAAAVADGQYPDGFQQWLEYGQFEGRTAV
jgi:hypothetical protein